jgi:hypothetical protein
MRVNLTVKWTEESSYNNSLSEIHALLFSGLFKCQKFIGQLVLMCVAEHSFPAVFFFFVIMFRNNFLCVCIHSLCCILTLHLVMFYRD